MTHESATGEVLLVDKCQNRIFKELSGRLSLLTVWHIEVVFEFVSLADYGS